VHPHIMAERLDTAITSVTALGLLHCVSVGSVTDVSGAKAASICRVNMSSVHAYIGFDPRQAQREGWGLAPNLSEQGQQTGPLASPKVSWNKT
jgi:hypothetical protein